MISAVQSHAGLRSHFVYGLHPVFSAIFFAQRNVEKLFVRDDFSQRSQSHELANAWIKRILSAAHRAHIPVVPTSTTDLSKLVNGRAHQGVVLKAGEIPIQTVTRKSVAELLHLQSLGTHNCPFDGVRKQIRPLALLIDHLTDVMNFGSIVRSAVFFGASAIILSPSPCVGPSPLVSKLSVGALESLPLYRLTEVKSDLRLLADAGFLIVGTVGASETEPSDSTHIPSWVLTSQELGVTDDAGTGIIPRPMIVALGSESRGLSAEVLQSCHLLVRVVGSQESLCDPTSGYCPVPSSLNVAVAAGILLYQLTRLRHGFEATGSSCFYI